MADDYIKRSDALDMIGWYIEDYVECTYSLVPLKLDIEAIPAADVVEVIRCQDCECFETDVWGKIDGIPLIVAHEMCKFWGGGCKTKHDGYCSFGRKKEET